MESDAPVRGLTADKDFNAGDLIYTETPLISALYPKLEVNHANKSTFKKVHFLTEYI